MATDDYHHGDLRRALVQAAQQLVIQEGGGQVSLRAIAREAGVSPAAPYHHFADRESLLAAVAASGFESLSKAMEEAAIASRGEDALERLRAAGIAYVRFAVENPQIYRLMFSGLLSDRGRYPELQQAANAAFTVLQRLLGPGKERTGEQTLPAAALAAWSTVHGLAFLLIEGMLENDMKRVGLEEIARQITTVLGRGLRQYESESLPQGQPSSSRRSAKRSQQAPPSHQD